MPTDIGVHDLTSNTSHSPFVVSATSFYGPNPPYGAFDSAAGNSFWIGVGGGVDKLQLDRGNGALGTDFTPHDLTGASSHSPIVVSDSSEYGGYPAWKTLDGGASYWIGTGSGVDWVKYDFGSGNSYVVRSYWIRVDNVPEPNRAPKNWTFEGSNDGSTWTTLHTVTNQTSWDNNETRYFTPTDTSTAYRYFRINITANNGDATYTQIDEVFFFTTAQDTTRSKKCGSYSVQVPNANTRPPKNWTLEGSNHDGLGWDVLDTQTNQTGWSAGETRTFTPSVVTTAYEAFRLNITANNGDGTYTEVEELTLYESTATTIDESITLGVTAGAVPTSTALATGSLTLGVDAGTAPAAVVAALGTIALGVDAGTSDSGGKMDNQAITLGVDVAIEPSMHLDAVDGIALGAGLHVEVLDQETFGAVRRGKTAVTVTGAGSGKATVR